MKIVFDIDGTLADCSHRLHFIQQTPLDWENFYAACPADKPIRHMVDLAGQLAIYNQIECWTGRPERIRPQTERWLLGYLGRSVSLLRMRADDDHRPDYEVKADYLTQSIIPPAVIFEDRNQVVDMFRERGIRVCQVAQGSY